MAKPLVEAFATAWAELDVAGGDLTLVCPPAVAAQGSASTVHAAVAHFEFRDGARFRVRYTVDSRDGARMILVEDDVGLRPGFLDDINAFLLEAIFEPSFKPAALIGKTLQKAVRMHSRAVAPSSSAAYPTANAPLARRSGASAAYRVEDHPLAAMLAAKRPESRRAQAVRAAAAAAAPAAPTQDAAGAGGPGAAAESGAPAAAVGNAERKRPDNPARPQHGAVHFGSSMLASTTLMKQLKILEGQDTRSDGFEAMPMEDDLYTWHVKLYFDDGTTSLSKDLAKLDNVDHLDLEFKFPSSYPSEPPVVRFLAPAIQGGHVTVHGAICMELLTGSGWSPVNSIDAVCIQIRALLVAGNARIDITRPRNVGRYTLEGALQDLSSIVFSHGWTVDGAKTAKRARNSGHANPV